MLDRVAAEQHQPALAVQRQHLLDGQAPTPAGRPRRVAQPEASGDDRRDADQRQHEHQRENELHIARRGHSLDRRGERMGRASFVLALASRRRAPCGFSGSDLQEALVTQM